jgi:hypothetical protein
MVPDVLQAFQVTRAESCYAVQRLVKILFSEYAYPEHGNKLCCRAEKTIAEIILLLSVNMLNC